MDEFAEKALLIGEILDRLIPIPEDAPPDKKDALDAERQMLLLRAGFNNMSVEELKEKLA